MDKAQLEEEKLKLEIKELEGHWFKKPQYLQVLLPTTLAIFSLLYAITSGLFSSKQELLELNKKRLETDIVAFEKEKQSLIYTNEDLKTKISKYNDSLQDRNLILKKYEYSFTQERLKLEALNSEVTALKNTKIDYNNQIALLEKEYKEKRKNI
jgi:chromosome segregation ATPase